MRTVFRLMINEADLKSLLMGESVEWVLRPCAGGPEKLTVELGILDLGLGRIERMVQDARREVQRQV